MENFLFWKLVEAACEPVNSNLTSAEIERSMVETWCQITGALRVECLETSKCPFCKIHTGSHWLRDVNGHCHKSCVVCHTPV